MDVKQQNELIEYTLMGEEGAFSKLYENSVKKIRKQLRIARVNSADFDDIIQETMLRVYARLSQLKDHNCYDAWLYKITKSVYLVLLNKQKIYVNYEYMDRFEEQRLYMVPQYYVEQSNILNLIQIHLKPLKTSSQEVLILRYLEELSEDEIAVKMKIPKGTVKSRLHYARIQLQVNN